MNRNTDGSGAVAIHRWFADGEGWAYHPWYENHKHELLGVLKNELERRRELESTGGRRQFAQEAIGGILLGEQVNDPSSPDEAAAGRYPTVLRVVFLRSRPSESDRVLISERLSRLEATRAGPDAGLQVHVNDIILAPPRPQQKKAWLLRAKLAALAALAQLPRPQRKKAWLLVAVAVLLLVVVGLLAGLRQGQAPDEELRRAQDKMLELLEKWRGEKIGKNRETVFQTAQRFLTILSQQELADDLKGEHPDTMFAKRLPQKPASPGTPEELMRVLESLARDLAGEAEIPVKKKPLALLDDIEEHMDYTRWWSSKGCRLDYAAGEKANPEVSKFTYRFLRDRPVDRANRAWQKPAAEKMVDVLRKWKVEAIAEQDAEKRPWFVFHCFFQLLSQYHFKDEAIRDDSWQAEFVRRLPKEPLMKDGFLSSERELVDKLRELAARLGAEMSENAPTLTTNIAKRMDYDSWKREAEKVIYREKEKGPPRIEQFVEKFRRSP